MRVTPYHIAVREAARASRLRREAGLAVRRERVRALWPTMSVRDMAIEMDTTTDAVLADAKLLCLGSRPIARRP